MKCSIWLFGIGILGILFFGFQNLTAQWNYVPVEDTSFVSQKFRLEASAGYSIRVGSIQSTDNVKLDEYNNSFKYGFNYILSLGYRIFGDNSGISLEYQSFAKSNKVDSVEIPNFGATNLKDDLSIDYYGISYMTISSFFNDKIIISGKFGIGSYNFKNDKEAAGDKITIESSTLGFYTYFSGEYNHSKYFCIGISIDYINGNWKEFTVNGTQRNDLGEESGIRWDFNLGLRYYL